jgi:hypothetical protein
MMLARLELAFFAALESVDAVEDHKAAAENSGTFTAEGILADTLQFAAANLAPKLKRARQTVEAAKAELAVKREKLVLKPADKTDAAGQMRRLWKLDKLAKMSDSERNSYIAENIDSLDPELVQGILEEPKFSGVLPSDFERLRDRALREQHGDRAIAELVDLEAGIAIADGAITAAREEIAQDVGGLAKFNAAAEPFEKTMGVLWLRKTLGADGTAAVKVFKQVSPKEGRWADATPEEIEAGRFFGSFDEWRAADGVWPIMEKANAA